MNIVLVEPEIPQNTGNIARLCAATNSTLHLVRPLGFFLSDKHMKRAGLDYWNMVDVKFHDCFEELVESAGECRFFFFTTKSQKSYHQAAFHPGDFLVFGPESRGLRPELLAANWGHCYRIPMRENARSLNLANSVAIVLYEALRQVEFPGLR